MKMLKCYAFSSKQTKKYRIQYSKMDGTFKATHFQATQTRWVSNGHHSLKLFGCFGAQGDDGVAGEAGFHLGGENVQGDAMLLSDACTDRRKLSHFIPGTRQKTNTNK